jgi:hypothetical protein
MNVQGFLYTWMGIELEEPRCFGKERDVENGGVGITY